MKIKYGSISKITLSLLKDIGHMAQLQGVKAHLVGGAVRDLLLGELTHDYDVMIEGDGIAFAKQFAQARGVKLKTYDQFGTATIIFSDDLKIDIASARSEVYSKPGALPVVAKGDIYDDMYRRDFTVNAMAMSILPDQMGVLYDPFAGYADINAKQLRVMHSKSFIDDPTRVMRLIRYQSRFGFNIEQATLGLVVEAFECNAMSTISQARFFREFALLLNEPKLKASFAQFYEFGLDQYLPFDIKKKDKFNKFTSSQDQWIQALGQLMSHMSEGDIHTILGKVNLSKKVRQEVIEARKI